MKQQTKRNYGIDLLRIISMFSVVTIHVLDNGGILSGAEFASVNYFVAWLMGGLSVFAVNCFGIISGYVMTGKKLKYVNIVELWFQVFLTGLAIFCLVAVFDRENVNVNNIIGVLFPVSTSQYWYFTAYFVMFFFIPFFNYLLDKLSQKNMLILIGSALFFFSFVNTIVKTPVVSDAFNVNDGLSVVWLSVLYFIGGYIKKYKITFLKTKSRIIVTYLLSLFLSVGWKYFGGFFNGKPIADYIVRDRFLFYTSPTVILMALCMFLFFSNIHIHKVTQKITSFLAPATFGVYIIHQKNFVAEYFLIQRFVDYLNKSPFMFFLAVIGTAVVIYVVASVIDLIRIRIFKLIKIQKISEFIVKKISQLLGKVKIDSSNGTDIFAVSNKKE